MFNQNKNDDVVFLTIKDFENIPFVKHAFSTRIGGVSEDNYKSMNLGFKTNDSISNVLKNYDLFCNAVGVKKENLTFAAQTHETYIRVVTKEDIGKGIVKEKDYSNIDGLITDISGIILAILYADCVPIMFIDVQKKVVGIAHAGWKGTVRGIAANMIRTFQNNFNSNAKDIIVGIGPSIGVCCYEVSEDVYLEFSRQNLISVDKVITSKDNNKYMLNLQEANKQILISSGIEDEHIIIMNLCTKCNSNLLFSYRAQNEKPGMMSAIIELVD